MTETNQKAFEQNLNRLDEQIINFMSGYGITILRIGLGIIFFWFGMLKFFPGLSPAEELVRNTVYFIDPDLFIPVLALWESLIGFGLISGKFMRTTLLLLFIQILGTALPLIILPEQVWAVFPFGLTLEGQYIVKNLVLIGAGLVLGGKVKSGIFKK